MQNIHVQRYANPASFGYQGTIQPEDRSWIVFVDKDGEPTLWRRVAISSSDTPDGGKVDHAYVDVELPGFVPDGHPIQTMVEEKIPQIVPTGDNPLDFTVQPAREPMMDAIDAAGHAKEDELYPNRRDGFIAWLNCRHVGAWGATEHDAIRALLNYVAKLCVAGSLDHTGRPMPYVSRRRHEAVFGAGE